jgi:hypothetical protein
MAKTVADMLVERLIDWGGFGCQMGGLYVTVFNWLEGPPAFAPALFAGFAAVGLITIYLL